MKIKNLYSITIQKYARGYITRKKIGRIILCAICLQYNLNNENKSQITCFNDHYFHDKCLNKWLTFNSNKKNNNNNNYNNNYNNNTCPICRSIIYKGKNCNKSSLANEIQNNNQNTLENSSLFTRMIMFLTQCFEINRSDQENERQCCCCF
jgi:hypothetical protein